MDSQKRPTLWIVYSKRNKKGLAESQLAEVESRGRETTSEKGNLVSRVENRGSVVGNHSLVY